MQTIGTLLQTYQLPVEHKVEYEFQSLGIELQKVYGKKVWPLFYRKDLNLNKLRDAFKIAQGRPEEEKRKSMAYFIAIARNLK